MYSQKTVCKTNMCAGCMACLDKCHKNAISVVDCLSAYNAVINTDKCINCGLCEKVCPQNNITEFTKPKTYFQGFANDDTVRKNASSGGIASALAIGFIRNGGVVCSCKFAAGDFIFDFVDSEQNLNGISGSKYVKSNPAGVHKKTKEYIENGRKVLFIGLPCQVAGLKNYIGESENLFTVDLICHGSPSPKLLKMFLSEQKLDANNLTAIKFREKSNFRLMPDEKTIVPNTVFDKYTYLFLNAVDYTQNCYECNYARFERISDITLGDSWGNTLSEQENKKGVSLILCQTEKGKALIEMCDIHTCDVDIANAIKFNKQLQHPSELPKKRADFFNYLNKHKSFSKAAFLCYPKVFIRQKIKAIIVKLKRR